MKSRFTQVEQRIVGLITTTSRKPTQNDPDVSRETSGFCVAKKLAIPPQQRKVRYRISVENGRTQRARTRGLATSESLGALNTQERSADGSKH